jgi:hypothetical protein
MTDCSHQHWSVLGSSDGHHPHTGLRGTRGPGEHYQDCCKEAAASTNYRREDSLRLDARRTVYGHRQAYQHCGRQDLIAVCIPGTPCMTHYPTNPATIKSIERLSSHYLGYIASYLTETSSIEHNIQDAHLGRGGGVVIAQD